MTPQNDPRINQYPLFVSYPRTGAHWINCVMEIYFDRPRLREGRTTFLNKKRKDWMWFHDHDPFLTIELSDILFLYREPVSTAFSNLNFNRNATRTKSFFRDTKSAYANFTREEVETECLAYHNHLAKWLVPGRAKTVLRYENFKKHQLSEFGKITAHFGQSLDEARCLQAFGMVTQEALVKLSGDKTPMGSHMLTSDYKTYRESFTQEWSEFIRTTSIPKGMEAFFA